MRAAVDDLPVELQAGELTLRYAEWGAMAVRHVRVPPGTDMAPVLEGLPDDRCPSPHWGIVLEGSINLRHRDGAEETVRAGEMYHWPAGHTASTVDGVVFLEVGPVEPMRQFGQHAKQKLGG
ncbi:MAG: hypothetical protein ACRDIX_02790 [Actinomycetota bacterium]